MEWAWSIFAQGEEMLGRGIALVPTESVLRVKRVDFLHDPVARDFGDDARGRDGKAEFVAPNDCSVRGGEVGHGEAVDQHVFGWRGQGADRLEHRSMCRPKDVNRIDSDDILNRYCPMHMRGVGDLHEQLRPEFRRQLLGIIQAAKAPMLKENDGRGHHGPGEGSAPGFINASDKENAPLFERALVPE